MTDAYYHRGPVTVCMPVSHFFESVVRDVVGPIVPPFRVLGITYDFDRDEANVDYVSSPTGPRTVTERVNGYSIDRILVVDAIARAARVYSRRVNRAASLPNPVREDWAAELRHDFPSWFDIDIECEAGWSDLIRAMAEWLWELGLPKGFRFVQIEEKFASLRAYSSGRALSPQMLDAVRTRVDAFETVSLFVCEQCGEPGRPRQRDNFFYAARDKHAHDLIA